MRRQTQAALATVLGLATTGVAAGYAMAINSVDHTHEQEALRENVFVLLLPTWPVAGLAALMVALFVCTGTFTMLAARPHKEVEPTAAEPTQTPAAASQSARIITSHLWLDHAGMRSIRLMNGRRRVVWASNQADAGWLYPNIVGEWDVLDVDLDMIGQAASEEDGMAIIRQHLLAQHGR